jgi:hypothetical protein
MNQLYCELLLPKEKSSEVIQMFEKLQTAAQRLESELAQLEAVLRLESETPG